MIRFARLALACVALPLPIVLGAATPPPRATPASALDAAPARDWASFDPRELMVMDLADGGRVVIALAPAFAPVHVANIRTLVRAGWFDGLAIGRVQDGYVTQWGDTDGKKPLPAGIAKPTPAEYERPLPGVKLRRLPYRDTFAAQVGYAGAFPVGAEKGRAWLAHCYGLVGVGRDNTPDTGTGGELYAVIGHAPRALDRNIALVGRVVGGMDRLTALPRGTADMGFYAKPEQRTGIVRVRIAADLPAADRPAFQYLRPDSAGFAAWLRVKANRSDDFYLRPAGAVDLCGALPPTRLAPRG